MFETSLKIEEEVNSIPSNMSGRYHRNKSQQQHRTKSKLRYVNKSELIVSSPNSVAVEQPVSSEDVIVNNNNNTVDDVASSSKTKTKEEYDYDNNDIDNGMDNTNRLDKLLTDIQQIELSEEEITINDQLQQDEVIINLIGLLLNTQYNYQSNVSSSINMFCNLASTKIKTV